MKKTIRLCVCFLLMGYSFIPLFAQSAKKIFSGVLKDEKEEPIIAANIVIKGTTLGTLSNLDGSFSILAQPGDVLQISNLGFFTQEIKLADNIDLNLVLKEDIQNLSEVIVVGYGTTTRRDLTGAIGSVSEQDLKSSVTANIDQALQGRIAGVQVTQNSGAPGGVASIRIRGSNSITGSSEPLYVVDGVPFSGAGVGIQGFDWAGGANGQNRVNPLSTINPADIVNIEVLKDASAAAIYGAQAANGVILITTRKGKKGESKISYNGYYASQELPAFLPMMNLSQFAQYQKDVTGELDIQVNQRYLDPSILGNGTNWQKEIFRNAGMNSHQISLSGGTDKTTYSISGGYFSQDGIVIGSNFNRKSVRVNLDNQVKSWLKIGANVSFANTGEKITLNDGGDGVIMQSLITQPDVPVKDFNGNYAGPENVFSNSYNPVAAALIRNNYFDRQRYLGNVYGDVSIFKGLTYRAELGFDNNHGLNRAFHPTYKWGALENTENSLLQREESSKFWILKNLLTYNKSIGKAHKFSVLAGQESQKSAWEGTVIRKNKLSSNDIQILSQGDDLTSRTNGWKDGATLASYFGRVNYTLNEKYLVTATLRADGSSKFGPNNKWGYFPSGSIAWRISEEGFLKDNKLISNLKLRLGYGEVGNQSIGTYLYGSALSTITTPFGTAYRLEQISNPNLKWEASTQWNAGMDISLLKDRINLTVDVYNKQTRDMLLQLSIPRYLGGTGYNDIRAPFANVGKLQNKGVDLTLSTYNIHKKSITWTTDLTFSNNSNRILELDDDARIYWRNLYWYSEFQTATQTKVGQPVGQFYGYKVAGIFKNQQDILNAPVQIQDKNTVTNDKPNGKNLVDKRAGVWIGDLKFQDLNGDGVINTKDQTVIGNPNPDFTFGFNNNISIGPLDLTVYFTGSYGGEILNHSRVAIEGMTSIYSNQGAAVNNRAKFKLINANGSNLDPANVVLANEDASLPRPTTTDNNRNTRMSDRFIEDGSYLRLQNLRLGYTLPSKLTKRIRLEKVRIYANGQNLKTFTKYTGYDPEIGAFNQDPLLQNVDMGRYPSPRTFTFGLDLDF